VDHEAEAAAQLLITGSRPAERPVEPAFTSHEEAGAETNYSADNDDNQNDNARENGMPRRSRRSPRHLRVSGQRRRRYRDERYPTQSPMPMAGAFVSPEMASGKVWITYPVAQAYEQHVNETEAPEVLAQQVEIAQENTPVLNETTEAAPQTVVETPVNEPAKEPEAVVAELAPQETPVEAASEVAAQPVADEPVLVEPETAEPVEETPVVAVAPKAQEPIVVEPVTVIAEPEIQVQAPVAAPEAEPVAQVQPVVEAASVAETAISTEAAAPRFKLHATAPMTKAPAPAYVQEPARHSDWVRPEFDFEGKGSAGGHAAVSTATAPATKPEMPSE
jgi:ribonuclease E